MDITGYMT